MDLFVQNKINETIDRVSKVNREIQTVNHKLDQLKLDKSRDKQAISVQMEQLIVSE